MITRHLIVTGRVQGVGYRYYLAYKARQFQVSGWVRNRTDGSVEAVIQGVRENVEALIVRAHRGPPKAAVDRVIVNEATGQFTDFSTRPTT